MNFLELTESIEKSSRAIENQLLSRKNNITQLIKKLKLCSSLFSEQRSSYHIDDNDNFVLRHMISINNEYAFCQIEISYDGIITPDRSVTLKQFFDGLICTTEKQLEDKDAVLKKIKLDIFGEV